MGRYSPSVREDPGGPLDFSPLTSALREMQDNRLRRRQLKLYEDREAEDRRVQGERERVAHEARVNDVRARGGIPILQAPIGQPTLRDMTPSIETRVPQALGGGTLRPMLRSSSVPDAEYRPDGTGRYLETIDGESYMVDPMQPARLEERKREIVDAPKRLNLGLQRDRLLREAQLDQGDAPEDLGRMDNSIFSALVQGRQGRRSMQQAEGELRLRARMRGIPGADELPIDEVAFQLKRAEGRDNDADDMRTFRAKESYREGLIRSRPDHDKDDKDDTPAFLTPNAVGKVAGDLAGKPKVDMDGDPTGEVISPSEAASIATDKVNAGKRAAAAAEYTRAADAYKAALAQAGNDPAKVEVVKQAYLAARAAIEKRYGSLQ